jgi:hypothetical protein
MYGGTEVKLHALLISVVDADEWSASCSNFLLRKVLHSTNLIGSWDSLRVSLDIMTKKSTSRDETLVVQLTDSDFTGELSRLLLSYKELQRISENTSIKVFCAYNIQQCFM